MKKILSILFFIMSIITFAGTKVKIPLNLTDMYLYKNLDTGNYEGVYPELLKDTNDNQSFDYKIDLENPDIILRVTDKTQYKNYNFIPTPITYRINILVNKNGKIRNISDLQGLKIAYIHGDRGLKEFEQRFKNMSFEKIKVDNEDIGLEKLEENSVDAFIVKDYVERNSFESSVRVIENILYREEIGVRKDLEKLYNNIKNKVELKSNEKFRDILRENRIAYYKYILKDTPNYNFVKDNYREIKVSLPLAKYALPLYYSINNIYKGMLIDILDEIENILEIPVEVTTEEGDINSTVIEGRESKDRYILTKPYYQGKMGIANRKCDAFTVELSDLDNSKIIFKNTTLTNYIPNIVENAEIISVPTLYDGFQKLLKGEEIIL